MVRLIGRPVVGDRDQGAAVIFVVLAVIGTGALAFYARAMMGGRPELQAHQAPMPG